MREVKARIALSQCQSRPRRCAVCVASCSVALLHIVSCRNSLLYFRAIFRSSIAQRYDSFLIIATCLVFYLIPTRIWYSSIGIRKRDSSATSRHVVEMKQTLKTFQRPNTQGKLRRLFRTILYFIHDMIKTLQKSRFVQDINSTKPFTTYPFCLTDLNLFARHSDTGNKKISFRRFCSFVRKYTYIYIYCRF